VNFDLTEDESMLKSMTERFVQDRYDTETRRAYLAESTGFSKENWALLGELGILAAALPEAAGGLDLGSTSIAVVSEALGNGMVVEPVIESAFFTAPLFFAGADDTLAEQWSEPLASGEKRVAFAHYEKGSRGGSVWIETQLRKNGSGLILNGTKPYVTAGHGADGFVVSARHTGEAGDAEGWSLYFVPADAEGLSQSTWRMADGSIAVSLSLENVSVPPEYELKDGAALLASAETRASLARSAEALGIMERLFAETLDYVRQREQFGTPIGKFQAIQHRLAAQYAEIEQARALLELAIVSADGDSFAQAVAGARAFIAEAGINLGHEAIQLHGGMGITEELAIGQGHKRLLVISRWPDNAEAALDRYIEAD
jgi:alkylation response protein AidB-like acyl-CoA dehydrogenase